MGGMSRHYGALLLNRHRMSSGHTLLTFSPLVNMLALLTAPRSPLQNWFQAQSTEFHYLNTQVKVLRVGSSERAIIIWRPRNKTVGYLAHNPCGKTQGNRQVWDIANDIFIKKGGMEAHRSLWCLTIVSSSWAISILWAFDSEAFALLTRNCSLWFLSLLSGLRFCTLNPSKSASCPWERGIQS